MENLEALFPVIVKFNLIACVILAACWWLLHWQKQPLERIRLIEISLLAAVLTVVLLVADAAPKVDLALLPPIESPAQSSQRDAAYIEPIGGSSRPHENQSPTELPFAGETLNTTRVVGALQATDATNMPPEINQTSVTANRLPFLVGLKQSLAIIFLIVSLLNLLYFACGFVITRRLVNRAQPISNAAGARIERIVNSFPVAYNANIVCSNSIDVPMVAGCWRPTVLLPERLTRPEADQLELKHSLAHEWGHIQLRDLLTWQLTSLCQVLLWMQPCYWVLRRELRVAQDQLADQFAIEQTEEQAAYATTLVELSRARQRLLPGALTMAGRKSNLYRRIEMMMNDNFKIARTSRKSTLLLFALSFLAAAGVMTSLQLTRAASPAIIGSSNRVGDDENQGSSATNEDNTKSVEHSGVVLDVDTGEPIAGVTVTVTRMESNVWKELGVTQSLTDENGRYEFTIPPEQLSERFLYIMFDIDHPQYAQRHCGSYSYGMIVENMKNGEQPWFSELKMVRGEKMFGRLIDENKRPVVGVQVRGECGPKSGNDRERSAWLAGATDHDGRFEFVAPYDGIVRLSFVPPDHCMKYIEVGEKRGDLGDFSLETGFPIHGIVKDAVGNPMSGLWVNIAPDIENNEASYEMKRSAKTDADGKFVTRALKAGKHLVEVETKATGALDKEKYANFSDDPPPAVFVKRSINVTPDSASQPFIIQAVPHVLITAQTFTPNGEISNGHAPSLTGKFDEQFLWLRGGRTGKGAFQLMVPHGIENAELRFTTNEHSALMVQMEGSEPTPQPSFRFKKLEDNIDNIKVVRHPAGILKLDIVDESGKRLEQAGIFAHYDIVENPSEEMMMSAQIGWNKEDGVFRLSSIVPGAPVSIRFRAAGFQSQTQTFTLEDAERRTVKVALKEGEDELPNTDQ